MAKTTGARPTAQKNRTASAKPVVSPAVAPTASVEAPAPKKRTSLPQFIAEVRAEARKVTWTSRKETWITSVMVFIMVVTVSLFLFLVDLLLNLGVNGIITDVLSLLEHPFEMAKIKVRRELSGEPALVIGVEHKLQQVFLNLFLNAIDAMPAGGRLVVRLDRSADRLVVSVSDTGSGIAPEIQEKIFNPFFTTKEHGTGLGLAKVFAIVGGHGGQVECSSSPGVGATFAPAVTARIARCPALATLGCVPLRYSHASIFDALGWCQRRRHRCCCPHHAHGLQIGAFRNLGGRCAGRRADRAPPLTSGCNHWRPCGRAPKGDARRRPGDRLA